MEPRINSLINPDLLDRRISGQSTSQFTLPSIASKRPAPVEPSYNVADDLQSGPAPQFHAREALHQQPNHTRREDNGRLIQLQPRPVLGNVEKHDSSGGSGQLDGSARSKHSVPIAEVLNRPDNKEHSSKGGLDHILLDGGRKRRRAEDGDLSPVTVNRNTQAGSNGLLTLPRPHSIRKKTTKRLPPLLQGLHQPPPDAGLFPRITEKDENPERSIQAPAREEEVHTSVNRSKEVTDKQPKASSSKAAKDGLGSREQQEKITSTAASGKSADKAKRNKWSDDETAHLLRGVARFGIGKWKKILECQDYHFKDFRTAVDLKDRFRTCRPADYGKVSGTIESSEGLAKATVAMARPEAPKTKPKKLSKPRKGTSRKDATALADMGIEEPFAKSTRRERRLFTKEEDSALLEGYKKHGSQWHLIVKKPQFETLYRSPRDLRDRFRTRYPDLYKEAGLKGRHTEGSNAPDEATGSDAEAEVSRTVEDKVSSQVETPIKQAGSDTARGSSLSGNPPLVATSTSISRPLTLLTNFHGVYSKSYDEESGDDYSPVTLNRNIFGWADANAPLPLLQPPSMSFVPEPAISAPLAPITSSTSHGITMSMLMTNDSMPPTPVQASQKTTQGDGISSARATSMTTSSQALPSLSSFLDFAPSANSRGPMFSLPPPSDLLSGFDFDGRLDGSHAGLLWEERDEL